MSTKAPIKLAASKRLIEATAHGGQQRPVAESGNVVS
jgi:hypothetical protein